MSTGSRPTSWPMCAAPRRRRVGRVHKEVRQGRDRRGGTAHFRRRAQGRRSQSACGAARGAGLRRPSASRPSIARLLPKDVDFTDATGTRLGARYRPLDSVGVYVPGGTAAYPSSVLMNIVPAKVAGVGRIVMVVPTPGGVSEPAGHAGRPRSPAPTRSGASAARRRWRRWPMARSRSGRSTRSPVRATPMSPPPNAASSARSASI